MSERYVYRSEKVDGRVRRIYVGTADSVDAEVYAMERDQQRRLRMELRAVAELLELDDDTTDLRRLEYIAIQERGYTQTKDRRWKRNNDR